MKAVRVNRFGGPEQLEIVDRPAPAPGWGQVSIRVEACALNFSDILQRQGAYVGGPRPPYFPGIEAAGVVEAVGPGIDGLAPGSRVMCITGSAAHAEICLAPADTCIPLPRELSFDQGAALPVCSLTACIALVDVAQARDGETVLIHAGAGGLGTAAVQIALALGLEVIAVASTESRRDRVRQLGAHRVIGYDEIRTCKPAIVLQSVGGAALRDSLRALAPGGRLVVLGLSGGESAPVDLIKLLFRGQTVSGFHLRSLLDEMSGPPGARTISESEPETESESEMEAETGSESRGQGAGRLGRAVEHLLDWVRTGRLRPQVGLTLPLDRVRDAHRHLADRDHYGKIVLLP